MNRGWSFSDTELNWRFFAGPREDLGHRVGWALSKCDFFWPESHMTLFYYYYFGCRDWLVVGWLSKKKPLPWRADIPWYGSRVGPKNVARWISPVRPIERFYCTIIKAGCRILQSYQFKERRRKKSPPKQSKPNVQHLFYEVHYRHRCSSTFPRLPSRCDLSWI